MRAAKPSFQKLLEPSQAKELEDPYVPYFQATKIGEQQNWRIVMSVGTIILIILVIALLGGFSGIGGGPFYGTGYYGGGGLGL